MSTVQPMQIRGARAMLDWSLTQLADVAGVSVSTLRRVEVGETIAVPPAALDSIRDALEAEGVHFIPDSGMGLGVQFKAR